jgi:plastocyanin
MSVPRPSGWIGGPRVRGGVHARFRSDCAWRPARKFALALVLAAAGASAHATTLDIHVATSAGKGLGDAVVVLDPLDAPASAAPGMAATIDQVNRTFVPRVSVLRAGAVVRFPNSDNVRHHVYSFSQAKTFDLRLYAGDEAAPVVFDKPGFIVLGCNIHDSMIGFVVVVDTPYFGKTPADGTLSLQLPPGRYRLHVWNPDLREAPPARAVAVEGARMRIDVVAAAGAADGTSAAWPE